MAGPDKQYQRDFARGLRETAQRVDAELRFFVCQGFPEAERVVNERSECQILDLPRLEEYDGIITLSRTIPDREAAQRLEARLSRHRTIPQVFLDHAGDYGIRIAFDDQTSLRTLIDHMVDVHGCRTFALITGAAGNTVADARASACWSQIIRRGGSVEMTYDGRWTSQGGRLAALELLKLERLPDAAICGNDDMASALIATLQEHGVHVPHDIKVTGFDARPDALRQGVTTIFRPVDRAGNLAV